MKWVVILGVAVVAFLLWRMAFGGQLLKVGDAAPDFSLPDQDGRTRTLADFRDKWLALYFFPRADTPG